MQIRNILIFALFLAAQIVLLMALGGQMERAEAFESCCKTQDARTCQRNLFNNAGK